MEHSQFLESLEVEFQRLRDVARGDALAAVSTCPGWTVAELVRHVGEVYLHKTFAIREGVEREEWPPPEVADEETFALLDRAYTGLRAELGAHEPTDPAGSWFEPDRTVGFWARRMAHETLIHRIDVELAIGAAVAPIPTDLALDGIDELLKVFASYGVSEWGPAFEQVLSSSPGRSALVRTEGAEWTVKTAPGALTVTDGAESGAPDATISGSPAAVLRWVWNRGSRDEAPSVAIEGSPDAVAELRGCIVVAT